MLLSRYFHSSILSKQKYITNTTCAFKVLKEKDMNYNEDLLNKANERSLKANNAVKLLSEFVKSGSGPKAIHRYTIIKKRLLPRHQLKLLFDYDSPILEIGMFAGMFMDYGTIPAASFVTGIGKIHGQFCIVGANDATVKGGALFPITITKQLRMQQLAYLNKLPCIFLVDSGGAFLPLQADIFPDRDHGGRLFYNEAVLSSKRIPQIALVCGSAAAGGAYFPTMAEEAIIVKKSGVLFLGGPPLVKAATGEIVTKQELGGAYLHCGVSGCTDYYAEDEEEAFEMCRESVLSLNLPTCSDHCDFEQPLYLNKDLDIIAGKHILTREDMYMILSRILDGSMFKEFKGKFGSNLIAGFGFLHGMLIGILANCDSLTFEDAQKGTHFIQLCEKRSVPLIFLQNSGNHFEEHEDHGNVLKDRAKMVAAHCSANVSKIVLNVSGCFGDDNFTMCDLSFQPNFAFCWPLAHVSNARVLSEKAILDEENVLSKLDNSKDVNDYEKLFENPSSAFSRASKMMLDGIILPHQTREILALCLEITSRSGRLQKPEKSAYAVLRM